nr:serine/threonine-protein kinase [Streptomyces sp. AJS327]
MGNAGNTGVFQPLEGDDPRSVAGYRLTSKLGAGGMGKVYLSYTPGGRPVAIKVIRPDFSEDAEFRRRFRQEVQAAQRVQGLYTAPVIDSDTEGPNPWLATAYVPGPPLTAAVAEHGKLPVPTVLLLVAGIAEALQVIHGAGIVHRDLKPSNVLLAADGPRVIDFGIARAADATSLTGSGVTIGTPAFMSPEQASGSSVTFATDVFALGQVAAFAAMGSPAFGEGTSHGVLYRIVHEKPRLDHLPEGLRELVTRCLTKDVESRPSVSEVIGLCREASAETQLRRPEDWLPSAVAADITGRTAAPAPAQAPPPPTGPPAPSTPAPATPPPPAAAPVAATPPPAAPAPPPSAPPANQPPAQPPAAPQPPAAQPPVAQPPAAQLPAQQPPAAPEPRAARPAAPANPDPSAATPAAQPPAALSGSATPTGSGAPASAPSSGGADAQSARSAQPAAHAAESGPGARLSEAAGGAGAAWAPTEPSEPKVAPPGFGPPAAGSGPAPGGPGYGGGPGRGAGPSNTGTMPLVSAEDPYTVRQEPDPGRSRRARKAKVIAISLAVLLAFAGGGVTAVMLSKNGGDSGNEADDDKSKGKNGASQDPAPEDTGTPEQPSDSSSEEPPGDESPGGEPIPNPKPKTYTDINLPSGYHLFFADEPVRATDADTDEDVEYSTNLSPSSLKTEDGNKLVLLNNAQKGSLETCRNETRFTSSIAFSRMSKGAEICVRTASGHIGLVTFNGMAPKSDPSDYIKLDLTVWRNALDAESTPTS